MIGAVDHALGDDVGSRMTHQFHETPMTHEILAAMQGPSPKLGMAPVASDALVRLVDPRFD